MNGIQDCQKSESVLNANQPIGIEKESPRLCKCGCGNSVTWNKGKGKWNKYIHTHRARGNYRMSTRWILDGQITTMSIKDVIAYELKEKEKIPPLCQCGCRGHVTWNNSRVRSKGQFKRWNRFIAGHGSIGRSRTEETKKKISEYQRGSKRSEKSKQNMSKAKMGDKNPMFGKGTERLGNNNPMYGRKRSIETRRRTSEALMGENHPNWQGGITKLPYSQDWTSSLRESIRNRDGYKCQLCFIEQCNLDEQLNVHHIDYDKQNSDLSNLISLCRSCHTKTSNGNRIKWTKFFVEYAKREVQHYEEIHKNERWGRNKIT